MNRHRLAILLLLGCGLQLPASPGSADQVVWFNPVGAKIVSGGGAIVAGSTTQALRITHPGGPPLVAGTVTIPLSTRSDASIDSLYICYRTVFGDPDPARITGITLRTMALPTATTTLFSDATSRQNTSGECLGLDVANAVPFGAPELVISYSLGITTYLEIGAIGIGTTPSTVGVIEQEPATPSLTLSPNRPNPFARATRIDYAVSQPGRAELRVFDGAGRSVRALVDGTVASGRYTAWWDGRGDDGRPVPAGVYFYRLSTNGSSQAERMIVLR